MVQATSNAPPPSHPLPSLTFLFFFYTAIGAVLSFGFGRKVGTLPSPDDLATEIFPTVIVVCLFIASYSLLDVMAVAEARAKHGNSGSSKVFGPLVTNPPEDVHLAIRVQANQVEQLPIYLVGAACFSIVVNGKVGAILSAVWAILRRMYAAAYRSSAGKTWDQSGISNYTIPAYIVLNSMVIGTAVHCLRSFLPTTA